MKKRKLTICSPVYNTEKYVGAMIESVLGQSYGDFDFLIYDDGSTDGSLDIIKSYKDERIHVIEGGVNKGGIWGRTQIINHIDTKYNMWMDSDDVFHDNGSVERAMKIAVKGNYDIVNFINVLHVKKDGSEKIASSYRYKSFEYKGDLLFEKFYPMDNHVNFTSKVFRTDLMKKSIPEEDVLNRRFILDDLFFAPLWFFHCKNYLHATDEEPIYLYHPDIGIAGSYVGDASPERIGGWCILLWHLLISVYNRMVVSRQLSDTEVRNIVDGCLFLNIARIIGEARRKYGDDYGDKLATVWHSALCADGKHILNGVDSFESEKYVGLLEDVIMGRIVL